MTSRKVAAVPAETAFRNALSRWLESHPDVSQRELARRAQVSHVQLQHVLKGWRVPTLEWADKIAGACGTTLAGMLGDQSVPGPVSTDS